MAGNTEATRLLCAGVHLDAVFRSRVVSELVDHAERPVAPPFGADVLPVLAHALRARREEVTTALLLAVVWIGFLVTDAVLAWDALEDSQGGDSGVSGADFVLLALDPEAFGAPSPGMFGGLVPGGWALSYAVVVLLLWLARVFSGRGADGSVLRKVNLPPILSWLRRRLGWLVTGFAWWCAASYTVFAVIEIKETWTPYPLIFPLLIAAVVWRHQYLRKRMLRTRLARQTFAETEQPALPARFSRIADCIRREQDANVTLYDANRPFVGAGKPREPWSVVLELQRADTESDGGLPKQRTYEPLSAREVIEMIRPRLKDLRTSAGATSVDRLRHLEIEEFVYLPAGAGRDEQLFTGQVSDTTGVQETAGVYDAEQTERHIARAAGEGGEARRHFLRIRVGAWNEQVVVSLLVRVHTQGGMLVLEVVPHVLGPIVREFREVDTIVAREPEGPYRDALRACVDGPAAGVAVGIAALRALPSVGTSFRLWLAQPEGPVPAPRAARMLRALCSWLRLGGPVQAPPDAPLVSLRQLASTDELSLFQEMDVARYIRTLQDRIGEGVRDALRAGGYRTDRLEQNITQINNSGVYIKEMSGGALATGTHGRATHTERSTA
ncbi:hypothetical protein OG453_22310 [Streptomyces sp. NBC_01381]|uniref:hypothetical protein n=1 Tax=Streptomyces sp. NBC_01381 TaxID=2903845 RepID=UPI002255F9C5|nr:hypothetical protein [Streptomyces sp. NBC_01381]MCX4669376.1 hypothetical protein [Streptomyces sp. NBC_01381]